jgi:DinB superfamily
MDILEYIRREMAGVRHMVDMTMKGMTPELFNGATPGTANAISATFAHFMATEDNFIQKVIQGKSSVWDSGAWSQKTGIPKPPSIGEDWSDYKHKQIAIQPLLDYAAAVWVATDAYLATLTPEELDRKVKFANGERTVADMLLLSASQSLSHTGEIAALKGVQGAKGLPI